MSSIRSVAKPSSAAVQHHALSAADRKTAKSMRSAINSVLSRVKLGPSLPQSKLPKYDAKSGLEKAPNGDLLFAVQLRKPPPSGAADMPHTYALVDPKKNQFYVMTGGGLSGHTFGRGPLALPGSAQFKGRTYTAKDVDQLGQAARAPAAKPKLHHYEAKVTDASWSYGSGIVMIGHPPSQSGINATVQLPYQDLEPAFTVHTDEKKHTLTVKIDGTSPNAFHADVLAAPKSVFIPVNRPGDMGHQYKIVFETPKGKQLFHTTFRNMLPV